MDAIRTALSASAADLATAVSPLVTLPHSHNHRHHHQNSNSSCSSNDLDNPTDDNHQSSHMLSKRRLTSGLRTLNASEELGTSAAVTAALVGAGDFRLPGRPGTTATTTISAARRYPTTAVTAPPKQWTIDGITPRVIAEQPGIGLGPNPISHSDVSLSSSTTSGIDCGAMFGLSGLKRFCSIFGDSGDSARTPLASSLASRQMGGEKGLDISAASPGLFTPNSEAAWMNLSISRVSSIDSNASDSCQSWSSWSSSSGPNSPCDQVPVVPTALSSVHSSKESMDFLPRWTESPESDGNSPTPTIDPFVSVECTRSQNSTPCVTPTPDRPSRTNSGWSPTTRGMAKSLSSSSVRGPKILMKPPPIHRSKLYQRRLLHRAKSAQRSVAAENCSAATPLS